MYVLAAALLIAFGGGRWFFYATARAYGRIMGEWDKRKRVDRA